MDAFKNLGSSQDHYSRLAGQYEEQGINVPTLYKNQVIAGAQRNSACKITAIAAGSLIGTTLVAGATYGAYLITAWMVQSVEEVENWNIGG